MPEFALPLLDKRQVRRAFDRAAHSYDQAAVLQRQIADELLDRLGIIKFEPQIVLDVGCGTGYAMGLLEKRYRKARIIGLDISSQMLKAARHHAPWRNRQRWVNADAERLPLAPRSIDLILSNVTLQWCDLHRSLAEFVRVLRPGGLLMFSTFGPDTLRELRQAWAAADDGVHVHEFIDMHHVGDALVHHQFQIPVVDVDYTQVTYATVLDALRDIKRIGSSNAADGRPRGLTGKRKFARFKTAWESQRDGDGRLITTYEIVFGHAWAPDRQARVTENGAVSIPVTEIGRL